MADERHDHHTWSSPRRAALLVGVAVALGVVLAACRSDEPRSTAAGPPAATNAGGPTQSGWASRPVEQVPSAAAAPQTQPTAPTAPASKTEPTQPTAPAPKDEAEQPSAATQKSAGAGVTVAVTWQGASAGPVFQVVLDTHSVDLDSYDLRQLAVLRTSDGREARPSGWDAPKGGHHRKGTLSFPTTAADGSPLIAPTTRAIELVVRDVAGVVERTFRWTL
ncbi:MAG: hypothetical protein HYU88_09460 [Chloroflexi bacterium]|nr:hypothetical protein [Chloroflexota bacterium]